MATPSWLEPIETKQTDAPTWLDPITPRSSLDQSRYTITGATGWDTIPEDAALQTIDTETGKRTSGTKKFNQFVPPETPLSEAPKTAKASKKKTYGTQFDPSKGTTYPDYREKLNQFIREQAPRKPMQEILGGIPIVSQLTTELRGPYIDPVHPEKTTNRLLGHEQTDWRGKPLTEEPRTVGKIANIAAAPFKGVQKSFSEGTLEDQLSGAVAFPFTMAKDATTALMGVSSGKDPEALSKFAGSLLHGVAAPVGAADLYEMYKSGKPNMDFDEFRKAWEEDPVASAMILEGNIKAGKGIGKGAKKLSDYVFATKPDAAKFTKTVADTMQRVMPRTAKDNVTGPQKAAYDAKESRGIDYIFRNLDILPRNEFGEQLKPTELEAHTLYEATENGINKTLREQDRRIKEAGGEGLAQTTLPLVRFWLNEIKKAGKGTKGQDIINLANKEIESLRKKGANYSLEGALEDLTTLNKDLQSGSALPIAGSTKGAMMREASLRRQLLDELLTKDKNDAFSELRKDMGALLEQRNRAGKLLSKTAKLPPVNPSLIGDYAVGQLAYGLATGSLASTAKGIGSLASKAYRKFKNDPNNQIRTMLEKAAKLREEPKVPEPRPPQSLLSRPEDMEPNRSVDPTETMIERGEARGPAEYDPSLRDIAPQGETGVTPRQIEQSGQQFRAGGPPKPGPITSETGGAGQTLTEAPSDYGQTRTLRGPQTGEPLDLNAARAGLREAGFPTTEIESMLDATRPPTVESTVAKQGKGAAGVAKTAAKYGVPVAAIAMYLSGDEETKKRMLALPVMAGMMKMVSKEHAANRLAVKETASKALAEQGMQFKGIKDGNNVTLGIVDAQGKPVMVRLENGGKSVIIDPNGKTRAGATFAIDPNTGEYHMSGMYVPDVLQRNKIGTHLYTTASEMAHKAGKDLQGDGFGTSEAALSTVKSLKPLGFDVALDPKMKTTSTGQSSGATGLDPAYRIKYEVQKAGGGVKGIGKVALQYGVPAALLAKFLSSDEETQKKMMALPLMAGILYKHRTDISPVKSVPFSKLIEFKTSRGDATSLVKNPTPMQTKAFFKEVLANRKKFNPDYNHALGIDEGLSEGFVLRFVETNHGDKYYWDARDAVHTEVGENPIVSGYVDVEGGVLRDGKEIRRELINDEWTEYIDEAPDGTT